MEPLPERGRDGVRQDESLLLYIYLTACSHRARRSHIHHFRCLARTPQDLEDRCYCFLYFLFTLLETLRSVACYSNLVGLFIHTKKVGHSIHHIFTAPKFQGPDGSQFQTNTPGTLMARSHWTRHLSHKNRGQIKNYCSRWNCSRRTCISRNIIGSRPQGCKLH